MYIWCLIFYYFTVLGKINMLLLFIPHDLLHKSDKPVFGSVRDMAVREASQYVWWT